MSSRDQRQAEPHPGVRAAVAGVEGLWDRLIEVASRVGPDDRSRSTPCPDTDVGGLIRHLAGVHAAAGGNQDAPDAPVDGLRRARAAQIAVWGGGDQPLPVAVDQKVHRRMLQASCLDLWVHTYDFATAIGEPVDLDQDSHALGEAWRYLSEYLPRLLARRSGPAEDSSVRIVVRGAVNHDAVLAVRDGRGLWSPDRCGVEHRVSGEPGALVGLLTGRGDPEDWRRRGALEWSGSAGEAFVRGARLFG